MDINEIEQGIFDMDDYDREKLLVRLVEDYDVATSRSARHVNKNIESEIVQIKDAFKQEGEEALYSGAEVIRMLGILEGKLMQYSSIFERKRKYGDDIFKRYRPILTDK